MNINEILLDRLTGKSFEDLMQNHFFELSQHLAELIIKQFTISDSDISHRTILHWEKENLIEKPSTGDTWRRYSFFDYVWLRVIKELRNFGLPIPVIRKIKAYLFASLADQLFDEISDEEVPLMRAKVKELPLQENENFASFTKEDFRAAWKNEILLIRFNMIVLQTIYFRTPTYFLITSDGGIEVALPKDQSIEEKIESVIKTIEKKNIISINITTIIDEFFSNENLSGSVYYNLSPLSRQEKEILEIIRSGGVRNINITLKDGGEFYTEILRKKPAKNVIEQIQGIIAKGKYNRITLDTENGKVAYINETEKRIIK